VGVLIYECQLVDVRMSLKDADLSAACRASSLRECDESRTASVAVASSMKGIDKRAENHCPIR
jgi:hypothetical protein